MGGSMYRKKTLLVSTAGGSSWTECMMAPTIRPMLIRRQDSGTHTVILLYTWKPEQPDQTLVSTSRPFYLNTRLQQRSLMNIIDLRKTVNLH